MKSDINSDRVKQLVIEAVKNALDRCATQHKAHDDLLPYATKQPQQLKLKLEFEFEVFSPAGKGGTIVCCPVIDLTILENK